MFVNIKLLLMLAISELEEWILFAKSVSMDSNLLDYVLSMFTDTYRDSFTGETPLVLSNRSLYSV